jgi:hypothetical protein
LQDIIYQTFNSISNGISQEVKVFRDDIFVVRFLQETNEQHLKCLHNLLFMTKRDVREVPLREAPIKQLHEMKLFQELESTP